MGEKARNFGSRHAIKFHQPLPVRMASRAGVIFENKRLTKKWSSVLWTALGSFVFSFLGYLPKKRERIYNFESHISMWPYAFIFFFIIFAISFHGDKIVSKLTEGITLLLSIAVIYWVVDHGFGDTGGVFLKIIMVIGLIFSLFSFLHAFSYIVLSRTSRLILSIWSSIILVLFAIDNIYRVYQNEQIENTVDVASGLNVALQYFLLGVCSIYIVQNILMLAGFLPGKGTFFNAQYFKELKELQNQHIKRYSDKQVSILHSSLCVLFTSLIFILNFYFEILPRHVAIWVVFVTFPYILTLYDYATNQNYR